MRAALGGGNDRFAADTSVRLPITVQGGAGNDTLTGGDRADELRAGEGTDYLDPGTGADYLDSGQTENVIDRVVGGLDDDGGNPVSASGALLGTSVFNGKDFFTLAERYFGTKV